MNVLPDRIEYWVEPSWSGGALLSLQKRIEVGMEKPRGRFGYRVITFVCVLVASKYINVLPGCNWHWKGHHLGQTIHPTESFNLLILFKIPDIVTWKWLI